MTTTRPSDSWNAGDPYEQYVGRWSRLVANEFLAWLDLPSSLRWLEVGCGTGALTAAIAEQCRPSRLLGIDPSEGFLAKASARLGTRAAFHVANAMDIPVEDSEADVDCNIVGTESGAFVEIQGTAERRPFSEEQLSELLALAKKGLKKLFELQEDALAGHLEGVDVD